MMKKIYDLSQPVFAGCPGWPTYEPTEVRYEATHGKDRFAAEQIRLNSHTGTHLDAPFHFYADGTHIDEMDLSLFMGPAVFVDLRGAIHEKEAIEKRHLERYDAQIGAGSIVLFNTGWHEKRALSDLYLHDYPYLGEEGARYLKQKGIKGVGTDCLSIGGWYEGTGRPCHEVLLSAGIWIVEELYIPDELMQEKRCEFMSFPLKLKGFSGAPARACAVVGEM